MFLKIHCYLIILEYFLKSVLPVMPLENNRIDFMKIEWGIVWNRKPDNTFMGKNNDGV